MPVGNKQNAYRVPTALVACLLLPREFYNPGYLYVYSLKRVLWSGFPFTQPTYAEAKRAGSPLKPGEYGVEVVPSELLPSQI